MFTIAIQCAHYQRRLTWMLSSLAQQKNAPLIIVDIAFMDNDGHPTTQDTIKHLTDHCPNLHIYDRRYDDADYYQYRGLIRNDQLEKCRTEWILFSDCDMVYHPEYFSKLQEEILANHKTAPYMLIAGRMSNIAGHAYDLVDQYEYPTVIVDAFEQASQLELHKKSNVGAGYFQLVNVDHSPHGGLYVDPKSNRDWAMFDKGCRPRSDVQFRRRIGVKRRLPKWFTFNQIHLNHARDPDVGRHLTAQR